MQPLNRLNSQLEQLINDKYINVELRRIKILSLLRNGANISSIMHLNGLRDVEYLMELGLRPEIIVKTIFLESMSFADQGEFYKIDNNVANAFLKAIERGADINKIYIEIIRNVNFIGDGKKKCCFTVPKDLIQFIFKNNLNLDINLLLESAILLNDIALVKFALNNGANKNSLNKISANNLHRNLFYCDKNIRDLFELDQNILDLELYFDVIKKISFKSTADFVRDYRGRYSYESAYAFLRSKGKSDSETKGILDVHALIEDYLNASEALSQDELNILEGLSLNQTNFIIRNKYNFSALHFALIAKNFFVAEILIKSGANIYAQNSNNYSCVDLISQIDNESRKNQIIKLISSDLSNVDVDLGLGETLADRLLADERLWFKVVEASKDPLFSLLKTEPVIANLEIKGPKIAIAHGDGFWSSSIFAFARLIKKKYQIESFLITSQIIARYGINIIEKFNAVINPGSDDSFPKDLKTFALKDFKFSMAVENHYQFMLDISFKRNLPYLGFCAGIQHLALYHNASIMPVVGFDKGLRNIEVKPFTLTSFMHSVQFSNCELKKIEFSGQVAHHYAVDPDAISANLEIGASAELNVPMILAHKNGIRYGVQYHPENFYALEDANSAKQKLFLDNFVGLVIMHYNHATSGSIHPIEFMGEVKLALDNCYTISHS
jgi:ankyrin repeat protein/anthranilate/para-aminobenzoate synthase component II